MTLLQSLPHQVAVLVTQGLVPFFILFNILGWAGLPGRDAARSQTQPSPEDSAALERSIRAAWWLGVLLSLGGIVAVSKFYNAGLQSRTFTATEAGIAGVLGLLLGIARGVIPRWKRFRDMSALTRRRILAILVVGAVAISVVSGVFYYNSGDLVRGIIASAYTGLLIGYTGTFVFEVGK
jgi:hypothetical protein